MRRIKETFSPSELPLLEVLKTERACLFLMCYAMETCAPVRSEHSSIHYLRAGRRVDDLLQQNARGKYGAEVPVGLSSERRDDPGACSGQLLPAAPRLRPVPLNGHFSGKNSSRFPKPNKIIEAWGGGEEEKGRRKRVRRFYIWHLGVRAKHEQQGSCVGMSVATIPSSPATHTLQRAALLMLAYEVSSA